MQITSSQQRTAIWILISVALGWLIYVLGSVLTPFVISAVLAYILHPLVEYLNSKVGKGKLPKSVWVAIVEVLFFIILAAVFFLLIPIIAKELPILRAQIPVMLESVVTWLTPLLAKVGVTLTLDIDSVRSFIVDNFSVDGQTILNKILSSIKIGGNLAITLISNGLLIPFIMFYLLMEWDTMVGKVRDLIPRKRLASVNSFFAEVDEVLGQYLRGQLLVMLILAVYYSIGLKLFGLDLAVPIGVFTGLAVFVPYIGFTLGLVLAALAGILQFGLSQTVIMLVVVYGLGQVIESFYLTPVLVGQRIGLHPLAVIFLLLAFGQLFGFVGILLALPLSAILSVALRRMGESYRKSGLYLQ